MPDTAKLAPFVCEKNVIATEIPSIIDPLTTLAPFYDKVIGLARGTSKRHVRIGVYGDSNLTADGLTGHLRRVLQGRFGDAGHGFVALAHPWGWYTHEDVVHGGTWKIWKQIANTTATVADHQYGLANIAAETTIGGAAAWVATTKAGARLGRSVSRFDVYYLKRPGGGSFRIDLDGKEVKTISTKADAYEAGFETVEAPDGEHELKCTVRGDGVVRLYGATLERDPPSVTVDCFGTGSLNFQRLTMVSPETRKAQLAHRGLDLVVIWLGTNVMWLEPNKEWARTFIREVREALPGVPILLLSPPDSVKFGEHESDPRIVAVAKQIGEIAEETDSAFWDLREGMGGGRSVLAFQKRGLIGNDRVHFSKEGHAVMGDRLLCAMFDGLGARLRSKPDAGCTP